MFIEIKAQNNCKELKYYRVLKYYKKRGKILLENSKILSFLSYNKGLEFYISLKL